MTDNQASLPGWLQSPQDYVAQSDHDGFVARSMLSMTGVLAHFRLDDGCARRLSPSAPCKLIFGFSCILLDSLATNYAFVLLMLVGVLARACVLPAKALKRTTSVAFAAAGLTFLVMLPALLLGQSHSALLIATKVLVSVNIAMIVALTTPFNEMTAALRVFHVPNLFIMTIDLALKNIVRLGSIALEVLTSLRLRSVGHNADKGSAIGGIGGIVFLKSHEAAQETYDAMTCRGFEGEYQVPKAHVWRRIDLAYLALLLALIACFIYLQGVV